MYRSVSRIKQKTGDPTWSKYSLSDNGTSDLTGVITGSFEILLFWKKTTHCLEQHYITHYLILPVTNFITFGGHYLPRSSLRDQPHLWKRHSSIYIKHMLRSQSHEDRSSEQPLEIMNQVIGQTNTLHLLMVGNDSSKASNPLIVGNDSSKSLDGGKWFF